MASSNLTVGMLGGGEGAGMFGMTDPNILAAQPQLALAQAMMSQGAESSPVISPYQALARVLQAGAGNVIQEKAFDTLANAYSHSAKGLSDALPPDHPAQAFLRSNDPITRMIGVQNAGKHLLQEGETAAQGVNITPRGARNVPGFGESKANIERPQLETRAPFEPGGEGQQITGYDENGNPITRNVPITAETRKRLNAPPGGTKLQPQMPTVPQGPPKLSDNQTVQNSTPVGTIMGGTPTPNPAAQEQVRRDQEEVGADRKVADQAQRDQAVIKSIQDLKPQVRTGWSADTRAEAGRILLGMGVPKEKVEDFLKTDVAAAQVMNKKFLELSGNAVQSYGQHSGHVMDQFRSTYPNLGTDEHAIDLQMNALYMDRQRQQDLATAKTNHIGKQIQGMSSNPSGYRGFQGFNEQFNKDRPAEHYMHAAEAMSGDFPWKNIKDARKQDKIIDLIPKGTRYMGPDHQWHIRQ